MKKIQRVAAVLLLLVLVVTGCADMGIADLGRGSSSSSKKSNEILQESVDGSTMQVTFLDVGQGDCTIIQTMGYCMLIDTGDNGAGKEVVEYLEEQDIDTLEYLILTHPDADHIGGADNVLRYAEVKQVLMPDIGNDTMTYEEVIEEIEEQQIPVIHPEVGQQYELGSAVSEILCPYEVNESDKNNSSVGIKLVHGKNSFVMCGDAEEESEKKMVASGMDLEADVLKCSHHGSNTATTEAFLRAVDPTWAIISCGEGNRYGHPHAEVIARLENDDVQIYRTDRLGTITVKSDGKNLKFSSASTADADE